MKVGRPLVIMGSGETSPTMVTVHRDVVARRACRTPVLLDTPYGFQENVADISAKARQYFARSVGLAIEVVPGLRGDGNAGAETDRGMAMLRAADWVFSGPGSPSYALRHWRGRPVGDALHDHVRAGDATIVFASAAACTIGRFSVPVYEIYKVGMTPRWDDGLDLLACWDLDVVVIPHYDNTEGGTHDTRYAYLGERRLRMLERELPESTAILGVDEHTAVVLDPVAGTAEIRGKGGLTVRRQGESTVIPAGQTLAIDELRALTQGVRHRPSAPTTRDTEGDEPSGATLREIVLDCERRFDAAREDPDRMVEAILEIETAITEWAADTEEDEGTGWARTVMRGLVVRLGELARAPADPLAEVVPALLRVRGELRRQGLYQLADQLRDALTTAGVELRDTPDGPQWTVRGR